MPLLGRSHFSKVLPLLCVVSMLTSLLVLFRVEDIWLEFKTLQTTVSSRNVQPRWTIDVPVNSNIQCPVSTKRLRYAEASIDTALLEKFWSNPIKCYGTFVELGAADGKRLSNTKFFEDYLGWNGVLIEAFNKTFAQLQINRPNTKNYNLAICPAGQDHVEFVGKDLVGGIVNELVAHKYEQFKLDQEPRVKMPCEPIGSLLQKSNISKINLFSLDVEGAELMVLKTMDWSIPVEVFLIEMEGTPENKKSIRDLMKDKGYVAIKDIWDINSYGIGSIHNEVFINPRYID